MKNIIGIILALIMSLPSWGQNIDLDLFAPGVKYSNEQIEFTLTNIDYEEKTDEYSRTILIKNPEGGTLSFTFANEYCISSSITYKKQDGYDYQSYLNFIKRIEDNLNEEGYYNIDKPIINLPPGLSSLRENFKTKVYKKGAIIVELRFFEKEDSLDEYGLFLSNENILGGLATGVQDSFQGLTLGGKYNIEQIKAASKSRGTYSSVEQEGNSKVYSFKDYYYAGHKWQTVEFFCALNDTLYGVRFQDSFELYEQKKANNLFKEFDDKLFEKYGIKPIPRSSSYGYYPGNNGISCTITNKEGESKGGSQRRYVLLSYYHDDIVNSLATMDINEL